MPGVGPRAGGAPKEAPGWALRWGWSWAGSEDQGGHQFVVEVATRVIVEVATKVVVEVRSKVRVTTKVGTEGGHQRWASKWGLR